MAPDPALRHTPSPPPTTTARTAAPHYYRPQTFQTLDDGDRAFTVTTFDQRVMIHETYGPGTVPGQQYVRAWIVADASPVNPMPDGVIAAVFQLMDDSNTFLVVGAAVYTFKLPAGMELVRVHGYVSKGGVAHVQGVVRQWQPGPHHREWIERMLVLDDVQYQVRIMPAQEQAALAAAGGGMAEQGTAICIHGRILCPRSNFEAQPVMT